VRDPLVLGVFLLATAVALAASHLLIVRLERIGARLTLTEAALGLLAALAADTPEIATAVTALVQKQNVADFQPCQLRQLESGRAEHELHAHGQGAHEGLLA